MTKRLDEWERQCPSKRIVLRGSWPPCTSGGDEDGSQYVNGAVSMLRGTIKPGKAVEYPRRIEELEDVASNSLHLNPEFMNPEGAGSQMAASRRKPSKVERKPCIDCKKTHREIFTFKRVTSGELKGKEWESVVQPIIEKWGAFVAEYV
ncbi:hypothetical protein FRC10_001602 [Ceratobasidium sp. 414]|nr:hypothetical protein FRC10_001602 [Ceratobasidium sp. 414]